MDKKENGGDNSTALLLACLFRGRPSSKLVPLPTIRLFEFSKDASVPPEESLSEKLDELLNVGSALTSW